MKWDRFRQKTFFHITAIDHAEISGKKPFVAGVAQLVEHPICNRAVGSSSLSASTTLLHENVDFTVLLEVLGCDLLEYRTCKTVALSCKAIINWTDV